MSFEGTQTIAAKVYQNTHTHTHTRERQAGKKKLRKENSAATCLDRMNHTSDSIETMTMTDKYMY